MHIYTGSAVLLLAGNYPDLLTDFMNVACLATVPDTVFEGAEAAPIVEDKFMVRGSSQSAPRGFWQRELKAQKGKKFEYFDKQPSWLKAPIPNYFTRALE